MFFSETDLAHVKAQSNGVRSGYYSAAFLLQRILADKQWIQTGVPLNVFRLSGIYGPTRSVVDQLIAGTARIINKEGQVFSRLHVEDIAKILLESINKCEVGEIYNLSDDMPSSTKEIIEYACNLMNLQLPGQINYEELEEGSMIRSFYNESRKVSNKKIKNNLGISLTYANYKQGIEQIISEYKNGGI
jgi:nucleoside-diphosphate-sugar epimerase